VVSPLHSPTLLAVYPSACLYRQATQSALDRHRKLAQAIANRDPNEARLWMSAHFDESVGVMLGGAR